VGIGTDINHFTLSSGYRLLMMMMVVVVVVVTTAMNVQADKNRNFL
jgi:hypothetical protein